MAYLMDHIVLNVKDEERMIAFYDEILQMPPERLEEYRSGQVTFPSIRINPDTIIDLFPQKMWRQKARSGPGTENLNHFCISMEKPEWDDLVKRLKANQIKIEDGPGPRWGARGTGISIYFRDPEENLIEARYYEN